MPFLKDGSVGLVITSPPYWDKADYGSLESNIGSIENYGSLKSMRTPLSR
jgi:site-specific DNA-methyltransferase (adenine-specific)